MRRIAIIGGGIAGLTAAWELARSGVPVEVTLFEASGRLGGIVETVREQGFTIECGPDGWVTEKPWARQLAEELGLGGEIIPSNDATRKTYILLDGALVAMPEGMRMMVPGDLAALDASPLFSSQAKYDFHREIFRAEELKTAAPDEDESVAAFVRRHFGDEVLEKIGAPLLSGVFGGDVATLSVRAVMAPFVAMEKEHGSLIAAVQARSKGLSSSIFTTLRGGLGSLIDAMVATIPPSWIRFETPVTGLLKTDGGWTVRTASGVEKFDAVLLAAPVHIASELLRDPDSRAAELMQMDASSAVVVAFGFDCLFELPPGFGFLVPPGTSAANSLLATTFVDQKFDARAPEGGRLIRAFFGGEAGARLLGEPDSTLIALARTELEAILGPLPMPVVTVVRRWPRSLPQYAVGHLERMAELDGRIHTLGGLWLLGNGYRGVGLPDLIRDARAAVLDCLGGF
ncbi:protoporphyrinogen oxidase [Granulicella arctica]|uniref:Coproporphyrinogen III oxidase n=1 Tax=Granulicella arctica TaxID=940613 RepID=A0A7Y9TEW9_9BACT|nr:protoporphyrinogen oxidase [Granulicella arctica]NYF78131.1 oxygen-dependent protoporphyrinogen oxidase [Granulicella arctica]